MTFREYASSFQRNANEKHIEKENICVKNCSKSRLFGIVVSMFNCHPRGSILGYTLEIFLEVWVLEHGPPTLMRTIG